MASIMHKKGMQGSRPKVESPTQVFAVHYFAKVMIPNDLFSLKYMSLKILCKPHPKASHAIHTEVHVCHADSCMAKSN